MLKRTIVGEAAMVQFGVELGQSLSGGALVFLDGDLGAGKTTLCRGILASFGHQGAVKSPTYTLVETYQLVNASLHHFDLYRLGDPEELEFIGIRDYLGEGNFCLIEWPNRGRGILPEPDLEVAITVAGEGRDITVAALTESGKNALLKLEKI